MRSFREDGQRRRLAFSADLVGVTIVVTLLAAVGAAFPGSEALAAPAPAWTACDGGGSDTQCRIPRGVAANTKNGHLIVADQSNFRLVEFDALGHFVKTWGWDVVESGPGNTGTSFEICVSEDGDICKAANTGSGIGQFNGAQGVALDGAGNVYLVDRNNHRVQKFDPEGHFLLTFGGGVNETSGGNVCPRPGFPGDVCKSTPANTGGGSSGEFGTWAVGSFITITPADKVHVGDENRIQRFDANGVFQDECPIPGETVQSLASDASGSLYVAYDGKTDVRKITSACAELPTPRFELTKWTPFVNSIPKAVAVNEAGHVFAFGPTKVNSIDRDPIFEFDAAGNLIANFGKGEYSGSTGLATNLCSGSEAPGNLYASNASSGTGGDPAGEDQAFVRAYGTDPVGCFNAFTGPATNIGESSATLEGTVNPEGAAVSSCRFEYGLTAGPYEHSADCVETEGEIGTGTVPVPVHADIGSLDPSTVYHFRLVANIGGTLEKGSDEEFKTYGPPVISAEHTVGATETEVTLKALVNPEGLATSCHFEYGLDTAYGQSTAEQAVGKDDDLSDRTALVTAGGLAAGTTYHWRIVCTNASDTTAGNDRTATTYRPVLPDTGCPNQVFRSGDAALLPDCRAYEMVSPLDKKGGDIVSSLDGAANPGGYVQASPDGGKVTYTALTSFGDQPNSFLFNQYLAAREVDVGWSNHGIHPPVVGRAADSSLFGLIRGYMAFSPDLCSSWLIDVQTPPPTSEGQVGYRNLYRRDNCAPGEGDLEALTPAPPPLPAGTQGEIYVDNRSVQGTSDDSRHALFVAQTALSPDAAPGFNAQIYDRFAGGLHLVSVLPGGSPDPGDAAVGSGWAQNLEHAVSDDGSRVYWTSGAGRVYLRLHPEQGIVEGECSEPAKACTVPVSAGGSAFFWAASADGSKALYSEGDLSKGEGRLYEFDLGEAKEGEPPSLIAEDIRGVAGVSEDLSRIYFASNEAISGTGQNSEGDEAQAGKPNLYLAQGGAFSFIATLTEGDLGAFESGAPVAAYNLVSRSTYFRATRVSPSGAQIAFQSRAPLTGFDNTDEASGKAAVEVFRYEVGGELLCVSCNPSGAWPRVRSLDEPYALLGEGPDTKVPAAAWIPTWEHPLNASNVLSEDGGRLFFNSHDALLPRDTNGEMDVYEWEAPGKGRCNVADPDYFGQNGGCLYLISSGESPFESQFQEATPSGQDVFFTTASSLVPPDPGLVDLYDARVGGGIPQPEPPEECEGEACQSPPPPPEFGTPASAAFSGPGNPPKSKPGCRKGKRKVRRAGKTRCVKRKAKKKRARGQKRRPGHSRRAAR